MLNHRTTYESDRQGCTRRNKLHSSTEKGNHAAIYKYQHKSCITVDTSLYPALSRLNTLVRLPLVKGVYIFVPFVYTRTHTHTHGAGCILKANTAPCIRSREIWHLNPVHTLPELSIIPSAPLDLLTDWKRQRNHSRIIKFIFQTLILFRIESQIPI